MNKEISDSLKVIDSKISDALENICELEKSLSSARTDEEGKVLKEDCSKLKAKFTVFNKNVEELISMVDNLELKEE